MPSITNITHSFYKRSSHRKKTRKNHKKCNVWEGGDKLLLFIDDIVCNLQNINK